MEDHPDPGAKEHQSYSPAFYGEPDNAGGEETQTEGDHKRAPAVWVSLANGLSRTFLTDIACHAPPRAVEMPRALSASATARNVVAPAFCASLMMGRTFAAC